MQYLILFLEGVITFISPCLLPMLPIYLTYFVGESTDENLANNKSLALKNAIGFVIGFSIVFVILGATASSIGILLKQYRTIVNIVTGLVIIIFGLSYLDILYLPFLNKMFRMESKVEPVEFGKAIIFGMVFSIGWTPCVSTFLGSALLVAANSNTVVEGSLLLLCYSLGLGLPFILSAILIDKMTKTLDFISKNYKTIKKFSGIMLIVLGLLIMSGYMHRLMAMFM